MYLNFNRVPNCNFCWVTGFDATERSAECYPMCSWSCCREILDQFYHGYVSYRRVKLFESVNHLAMS